MCVSSLSEWEEEVPGHNQRGTSVGFQKPGLGTCVAVNNVSQAAVRRS